MDGIPSRRERQAVWRHFCFRLFAAVSVILLPYAGLAQTTGLSGTQGAVSSVHFQILNQRTVNFGQHSLTFNRVAPPIFPSPVSNPAPAPTPYQRQYAQNVALTYFATVYDSQYSVIYWSYGDRALVAISNVNFDYLSTLYGFAEGDTFYENIVFRDDESSADADPTVAGWLAWARKELPVGVPGYVIVSGTGSLEMVQGLDALHQYYGANEEALIQEYSLKQAQWSAVELELKLHPPVRPNTVINYWPIKSSVYLTGSNQ
jgi:hypothetical protein